jgi:hypothetical protein
MIVYHRTSATAAQQILNHGFRDGVGKYLTDQEWSGVWFSDVPLDANEGAEGDILLQVQVPEDVITDYEWIEEEKPHREFLIPARLINEQGNVCVVDDPDGNAPPAEV